MTFLIPFLCLNSKDVSSQQILYAVKNSGPNFEFISIDCLQDSITILNSMPINYYGATFSSSFDHSNQKYYYSTGQLIYKIDALTGIAEDTFDFSSIHPYFFYNITYNEKDGFIYGIQQNISTLQTRFSRFNTSNGSFVNVSSLPTAMDVGIHCKSTINLPDQKYIIQSQSITTIDLLGGNIMNSILIDSTSFDTFNHIYYNCKNSTLYGLHNRIDSLQVHFANFDTVAGSINVISNSPLPVNYYSQNQSGSTIDKAFNIFYYAALNGWLYGIDITTGSIIYSHNFGPGFEFLFIESSDQSACPLSSIESLDIQSKISLYPNPIYSLLQIQSNDKTIDILEITDMFGKEVFREHTGLSNAQFIINLEHLNSGVYVVNCINKSGNVFYKAKVIKN